MSPFILNPNGDFLEQTYPLLDKGGKKNVGDIMLKCQLLKLELTNMELAKCRAAFEAFDEDGSGAIDSDVRATPPSTPCAPTLTCLCS